MQEHDESNKFSSQISTADLEDPSGNWLLKRIWWEKAENLYDAIKQIDDSLFAQQKEILMRHTQLGKTVLEPFYLSIGMDQGALTETLAYLKGQMQPQPDVSGNPQTETGEQTFQKLLLSQQQTIDQLQRDIQSITQVDAALDDAIATLVDNGALAHSYTKNAWRYFKEIGKELSDKRARELYYTIETLRGNVENIANWVSHSFVAYLDQQEKALKDQIDHIKSAVQSLKEKGIDLVKQYKEKVEAEHKKQEQRAVQEKESAVQKAIEETKESFGFLDSCRSVWNNIVASLKKGWDYLLSLVSSGSHEHATAVPVHQPQQAAAPQLEQKALPALAATPKQEPRPAAMNASSAEAHTETHAEVQHAQPESPAHEHDMVHSADSEHEAPMHETSRHEMPEHGTSGHEHDMMNHQAGAGHEAAMRETSEHNASDAPTHA
jgi:hypothetical protein